MKRIQAKKHKIRTYEIDKISLSCFDDKRYVFDDGIHTLACFHKDSVTSCKRDCVNQKKILSSIVIEVIRTVFILFFFMKEILSI